MENSWRGGRASEGVLLSRVLIRSGRRKSITGEKRNRTSEQSNGTDMGHRKEKV